MNQLLRKTILLSGIISGILLVLLLAGWGGLGRGVTEAEEWLDVPGMNFDIRAGHPRLLFRGQQEWDAFKAKVTDPANADEYLHYQRMKNYVDTYAFDEGSVGHWEQALRWYLSRAVVARLEEGSYKTAFLDWVQQKVNSGPSYSSPAGFIISLAFDWFYDDLSDLQKKTYIDYILKDAPMMRSSYSGGSWRSNTFSEVFSTILGSFAIYGESYRSTDIYNELKQADFWYHEFVKNTQLVAGNDGGHFDGSSYFAAHMYGLIYDFWAWSTATSEDGFTTAPYFTKIGEWVYLHTRFAEDGKEYMVDMGDSWYGGYQGSMGFAVLLNSMKLSGSQYSMALINKMYPAGIQNMNWSGAYGYMNTYYLLFKPDTFPAPINPQNAPLAKRFAGLDQVVWRTGYNIGDTFFAYKHNDKMGGHDHEDAGHFEIAKFGRGLAIDAGAYEGGDHSYNGHWWNYYRRTIAHNLVSIFDPNEDFRDVKNEGGQKYYREGDRKYPQFHADLYDGSKYDRGGIKRYEQATNYNYFFADVTPAYSRGDGSDLSQTNSRKCANFTRQIAYLQPDYFIICDRVGSTDPSFKKRWLLHFQKEPVINGAITGNDSTTGRTDYNGDLVIEDNGQARLFVKSLLPENRIISKRGGPAFEYWVGYEGYGAYNAPPDSGASVKSPAELGAWRIEVEPATEQTDDIFLHVLYPTDSTTPSMPEATRIDSTTNNMVGTQINDPSGSRIALFSRTETKSTGGLSEPIAYTISGQGDSKHLIVDLKPNTTFTVQNTNLDTGYVVQTQTKTSSSQGTLYFETTLDSDHQININPEGAPQIPNITLTKNADKTQVSPGEELTYTITYQNIGTGEARNIVITDTIPNGTTYVAGSATAEGVFDGTKLTWTITTLPAGGSGAVSFGVKVE